MIQAIKTINNTFEPIFINKSINQISIKNNNQGLIFLVYNFVFYFQKKHINI